MQHFPKLLILLTALTCGTVWAQTPAPTAAASATASPSATPRTDITAEIVKAENTRGKIDADLKAEPPGAPLCDAAASLSQKLDAALASTAHALAGKPSLNTVRDLQASWQDQKTALAEMEARLAKRHDAYRAQLAALDAIIGSVRNDWTKLLADGNPPSLAPAEWKARLADLERAATDNKKTTQKQMAALAGPIASLQKQELQVNDIVAAVDKAEPEATLRLFLSDSTPIWRVPIWSESRRMAAGLNVAEEAREALQKQYGALIAYVQAQSNTLLTHAAAFLGLLAGLWWARRRVSAWAEDEPSLKAAIAVFEVPTSMALAFSLVAFPWIYEKPPQLMIAAVGAAALIPAILILRRLLDRHLFLVLNLLVVFYFVDQLRTVAAGFPIVARLMFLAEMAAGCGFLGWMLWDARHAPECGQENRQARAPIAAMKLELAAFAAAFFSNAIGCVDLGNLAGNTALGGAYLAVVLYAAIRILDGIVIGALSVGPLSTLAAVHGHRRLIWHRAHVGFKALAAVLWVVGVLGLLSLRTKVLDSVKEWFWTGQEPTLVGQIAAFVLVVWAAFLLSRFIRFVLEEDFYPRVKMERGLSYAVSTMVHYAVLLIGFFIAANCAHMEMTKFTILVSAFGVGMGFGLQNIINNFVSGVILLFERPVKVGDVVQLDAATAGTVDRIGIRASVIRTGSGSEIILPNSKLISDQVINWTLSNRQRGIDLTVTVAYGTDPCRVIELLKQIPAAHPLISKTPAPSALLGELGAAGLQFKMTAWTDKIEACGQIHSDLAMAILAAFEKEGIQRPPVAAAAPTIA